MPRTAFFSKIISHSHPIALAEIERSLPQLERHTRRPITTLPMRLQIGSGTDTHTIAIPTGTQYAGCTVITIPQSSNGATAIIENQPDNGSTGNREIKVKWYCPPGGQIRYRIRAYSEPIPSPSTGNTAVEYEEITIVNQQSVERLRSLMDSRRPIIVRILGEDAEKINSTGITFVLTGFELALIIAILTAAFVSVFAIHAIAQIVFKSIEKDYDIDVDFQTGGWNMREGRFELPAMEFKLTPKQA